MCIYTCVHIRVYIHVTIKILKEVMNLVGRGNIGEDESSKHSQKSTLMLTPNMSLFTFSHKMGAIFLTFHNIF